MKKIICLAFALFLSNLSVAAINNRGFRSDMTFIDLEDITYGDTSRHRQEVRIINHFESPILITEAVVRDKGTNTFEGLQEAENFYKVEVLNISSRKVLAYQIRWILKHPFEDYVYHKLSTNSINSIDSGKEQELSFRKNKHYRDDAYYYVEVSKVQYADDESIWEAPELENYKQTTQLEEIKKEIDAMEDGQDFSNPDKINLDEIKKHNELLEEAKSDIESGKLDLTEMQSKPLSQTNTSSQKVELEEVKTETVIEKVQENENIQENVEPVKDTTETLENSENVTSVTTTTTTTKTTTTNKNQINESLEFDTEDEEDYEDEDFWDDEDWEDEEIDFGDDDDFMFDDEDF